MIETPYPTMEALLIEELPRGTDPLGPWHSGSRDFHPDFLY